MDRTDWMRARTALLHRVADDLADLAQADFLHQRRDRRAGFEASMREMFDNVEDFAESLDAAVHERLVVFLAVHRDADCAGD